MKKRMKKILALIMSLVLTTTLFACGDEQTEDMNNINNSSAFLTRGQWVVMLANAFGIDEFSNESPYYTDVDSDDDIFIAVQACYEWDILSTGTDKFKPDEIATLGFVVTTSVLAAELDYDKYATSDNINESIINCANEYGITDIKYSDSGELNSGVTSVEVAMILNSAVTAYMEIDNSDICEYTYKENVIDGNEIQVPSLVNDTVNVVSEKDAKGLETDSIVIMPSTDECPNGYAVKIVSKTKNSNGTYSIKTETPELYDIFDGIDIDTSVEVTSENFIPAEGITVINKIDTADDVTSTKFYNYTDINNLGSYDSKTDETASASANNKITLKVDLLSGKIKADSALTASLGDLKATYTESVYKDPRYDDFYKLCEDTKFLPPHFIKAKSCNEIIKSYKEGKINTEQLKEALKQYQDENGNEKYGKTLAAPYSAGYSLTGEVSVSMTIDAEADIDFHAFSKPHVELKKYSITVKSDFDSNLDFKGKLSGAVKLGTISVPIGGPFSVDAELYAFADVNGEIKFTTKISNTNKIEYEKGSYKKTNEKSCSQSLEIKVSLEMGFKVTVYLSAFGLKLVDVSVSASALLEADAMLSREVKLEISEDSIYLKDAVTLSSSVIIYLPLVKVSVGDSKSLVKELGLSLSYDIYKKEDKHILVKKLFDDSVDWIIYEESIPLNEDETTTKEEITTSNQEATTDGGNTSAGSVLTLSEFVVSLNVGGTKALSVTIPEGYSSNDLVWSTSDSTVVTVSDGNIKSIGEGSATITVATKDGKYKGQCFVTVN